MALMKINVHDDGDDDNDNDDDDVDVDVKNLGIGAGYTAPQGIAIIGLWGWSQRWQWTSG